MLSLHLAAFLFGMAGLFSKFLLVPATVIVWGRATFAVIATIFYLRARGQRFVLLCRSDGWLLITQGVVLAFHWFAFFYSIQISSVAVGLLSFSTFPVFVLAIESLLTRRPIQLSEVCGVALILIGLAFIVPKFSFDGQALMGVVWGVLAGFSFAVLTLLNRKLSAGYRAAQISLAQNFVAALVLTPLIVGELAGISGRDWLLLLVLGIFCTALAHSLFIYSLTKVRAFVASIVASLEPVYGICAAFLILGEVPTVREVFGGMMILAAAIALTLRGTSPAAKGLLREDSAPSLV